MKPTLEHHWENKCREHLAEVQALREKCRKLETEQALHALRKEIANMQKRQLGYTDWYTKAVRTIRILTEENRTLLRDRLDQLSDDSLLTEVTRRGFATYQKVTGTF